jgi:hypothetical protein
MQKSYALTDDRDKKGNEAHTGIPPGLREGIIIDACDTMWDITARDKKL